MFGAIHQHLKQYLIQNFSLTLVVLSIQFVKYSIVASHLHLQLHLLLLRWYDLYRRHSNQLARQVRRQYEGLKLY